jgi:uncharacterized SAM-binding protein YcdF (DUF218 family)
VVTRRRSFKLQIALTLIVVAGFLAATRTLWLSALGGALVRDDGPAKADMAVVLAGDQWGNRVLRGAELARQGYVPRVLVSGPPYYGTSESELAIDFAVAHGNPREWFVSLPLHADSTREEAAIVLGELERRNIHSFLLVTSDYHTGRAGRLYREALRRSHSTLQMRVVAAPDKDFRAGSWWKSREGQKTVFYEWCKTVAAAVGN